jgi:hypothetical protein
MIAFSRRFVLATLAACLVRSTSKADTCCLLGVTNPVSGAAPVTLFPPAFGVDAYGGF